MALKAEIAKAYGNRIRVRVGALIIEQFAQIPHVLLVEHSGLVDDRPFWTPPGGAIHFGESLTEGLVREVHEETGLVVEVGTLRYVADYVAPPLHAVSFYFECRVTDGALLIGTDPELHTQLIQAVDFLPIGRLGSVHFVPRAVAVRLEADVPAGFPENTVYLGTAR